MSSHWPAIGTADLSLSEQIYLLIRERIISGELEPGRRLIERELSQQLGVSRIPLREALGPLEADGFIRVLPRRGAVVTQLTVRDIEELFDVRESLEVLAARLATARRDEEGLAALADCVKRARESLDRGDDRSAASANVDFHVAVVALSGNRLLSTLMQPLSARMQWLFRLTADRDIAVQCAEHEALFTAIESGQVELAAALAFSHVAGGREPSLRLLREVLPESS